MSSLGAPEPVLSNAVTLHSLPLPDHSNLRPLRHPPERMTGFELTLFRVDGQGVVLLQALWLAHL